LIIINLPEYTVTGTCQCNTCPLTDVPHPAAYNAREQLTNNLINNDNNAVIEYGPPMHHVVYNNRRTPTYDDKILLLQLE